VLISVYTFCYLPSDKTQNAACCNSSAIGSTKIQCCYKIV